MFLRPTEAATLAGLSTRAIYRAVQRGELQAVRLCSRLRIPREAFDEWIELGRVHPVDRAPSPVPPPPRFDQRGSFRRRLSTMSERSVE